MKNIDKIRLQIVDIMIDDKWTVRAMERASDVHRTSIRRLLYGNGGITASKLCELCNALGYELELVKR